MTEVEVRSLLGMLAANYREMQVNEPMIKIWAHCLESVQPQHGLKAVIAILKSNKWSPTLSEILESVKQVSGAADNNNSGDAWGTCLEAIRRFGYYREVDALNWLPARIAAAVKRMGWKTLCTSDNQEADRAHFMRIYDQVKTREEKEKTHSITDAEAQALISRLAAAKSLPSAIEPRRLGQK